MVESLPTCWCSYRWFGWPKTSILWGSRHPAWFRPGNRGAWDRGRAGAKVPQGMSSSETTSGPCHLFKGLPDTGLPQQSLGWLQSLLVCKAAYLPCSNREKKQPATTQYLPHPGDTNLRVDNKCKQKFCWSRRHLPFGHFGTPYTVMH